MKNPNGYGAINKLSGKRRRPYMVRITAGWDIVDGKAKQLYKTVGYYASRKDALNALAAYNTNPYELDKYTFDDLYLLWSKKHFETVGQSSINGIKSAYKHCEPLYNLEIKQIKVDHMQAVLDSKKDLSKAMLNKILLIFKSVFKIALERDLISKDYTQFLIINGKETEKKTRIFTTDEIKLLYANLDYTCDFPFAKNQNLTYILELLLYTGMRISELLAVRMADIKDGFVHVHGTKTKAADRVIPIHPAIAHIIKNRAAQTYLIEVDGKPLSYDNFKLYFLNKMMKHLKLNHTAHDFRHTFISHANDCGLNTIAVKRIVGHSNADVTEHYTHKTLESLQAEMQKFTPYI